MSATKWLLGSSVFLAALAAFVISTHVVNAALGAEDGHRKKVVAQKSTGTTQGAPVNTVTEGAAGGGKTCTDMDGTSFGWRWPNVPFGSSGCR